MVDELVINAVVTFGSVFLGFWLAMWWDRRKEKENIDETKKRILQAIIPELKVFIDAHPSRMEWNSDNEKFDGDVNFNIPTSAFDSAVNSGNFSLLRPSLQINLSSIYASIHTYQVYVEKILNFYYTPLFVYGNKEVVDREANNLASIFNSLGDILKEKTASILPQLESEENSLSMLKVKK